MSQPRTCSRPIQSCFQCRKRKIRCNRAVPCAPCLLRGEGNACHAVVKLIAKTVGPAVPPEAIDEVLNRVVALERSVSKLSKLVASGSDHEFSKAEWHHHIPLLHSAEEETALDVEDIAIGNRTKRRRVTEESGPDSGIGNAPYFSAQTAATPVRETAPLSEPSSRTLPVTGLPEGHPLALLVQSSSSVVAQILSYLPNESCSRTLVRFYFDRVEWYSRIFHSSTFSSETNILLEQVTGFSRLASPSSARISLPFLSTYFMVLCLAYHLLEPEVCQAIKITLEQASEMSRKMFNGAQLCLWIDNYLENHSLESVQTLILMGMYQQNLGDSASHWALLGSAIKIAQNLGLDRLGSESDKRVYTGPWKSLVKREIGRRVWWNLIHIDWSSAAAHNGVYAIIPAQNKTAHPMNVDDGILDDDLPPTQSAPLSQYTEMTYTLTRFRLVEIYRQIVDSVERHPMGLRYNTIAEIDSRLSTMLKNLPDAFHVVGSSSSSSKGIRDVEYTMSLIMGEALRMRLHRPFLFRGYREERYGPSRHQCVASARAILKYLGYDPTMTTMLLRRWSVMLLGFSASIVLLVDICHRRGVGVMEEGRRELQGSLNLFRAVHPLSPISRNTISLLEGMITAAECNFNSKERRADDNRWNEVAKQAIVNANANGKFGSQQLAPLLPSLLMPNVSGSHNSPALKRKSSHPPHVWRGNSYESPHHGRPGTQNEVY